MAPYDHYQNVHPYDQSQDQYSGVKVDDTFNDTLKKIYKIINNHPENHPSPHPQFSEEDYADLLNSGPTTMEQNTVYETITDSMTYIPDIGDSEVEIDTTIIPEIVHTEDPSFFASLYDTSTVTQYVFTKSKHHHDDDSESMPYIILVVVLAILVLLTAIAMFIYYRKKRTASKDLASISTIGKSFEAETKSDIKPHEVMYDEERQESKRGVKFDDDKGKKTTK